jgi:pilus assembly protein CpaE
VFTGADPRFSLVDALDNTHRLDKSFLQSLVTAIAPHTDLLAAPETPVAGPAEPQKVRRISEIAAANYKHTVLDVPRSDRVVLDGLDHLQSIYIVINQEVATVKSATRLVTMLRQRYGPERVAVVLSRSDREAGIAREDVERALGVRIAHTFPSNYRVALQALNKGRPLALENHNDLSASFRRFAQQLSGVHPREKAERAPGLLARLTYRRA